MLVIKIGGPAYRIGMGGGAASSLPGGSNKAELDFNAVQVDDRDREMLMDVERRCGNGTKALESGSCLRRNGRSKSDRANS